MDSERNVRRVDSILREVQQQSIKIIYDIIKDAYNKVLESEAIEIVKESEAEETIGTWVLDTEYMLSMLALKFGLES